MYRTGFQTYFFSFSFFLWSIYFLHYLILKEDGLLSSRKPQCHPILSKPNLNFLLIYLKILRKQPSQTTSCSNHSLQIASYTRMSNIFTESNMMVKVFRYLPKSEVVIYRCLQPFTGKRLFMTFIHDFFSIKL